MGYLRPTAIIVTGSFPHPVKATHWIYEAHDAAREIFGKQNLSSLVGEIIPGMANDCQSFLIAWDGSKEGWDISDFADLARGEYVEWLRGQAYEDGASPLDWVELQYGGDDEEVVALQKSGR